MIPTAHPSPTQTASWSV